MYTFFHLLGCVRLTTDTKYNFHFPHKFRGVNAPAPNDVPEKNEKTAVRVTGQR